MYILSLSSIKYPYIKGPEIPPTAVPMQKKNAIAKARTSKGNISLIVKNEALASAEAKKKTTEKKIQIE